MAVNKKDIRNQSDIDLKNINFLDIYVIYIYL